MNPYCKFSTNECCVVLFCSYSQFAHLFGFLHLLIGLEIIAAQLGRIVLAERVHGHLRERCGHVGVPVEIVDRVDVQVLDARLDLVCLGV